MAAEFLSKTNTITKLGIRRDIHWDIRGGIHRGEFKVLNLPSTTSISAITVDELSKCGLERVGSLSLTGLPHRINPQDSNDDGHSSSFTPLRFNELHTLNWTSHDKPFLRWMYDTRAPNLRNLRVKEPSDMHPGNVARMIHETLKNGFTYGPRNSKLTRHSLCLASYISWTTGPNSYISALGVFHIFLGTIW
jgi:hypothetical protein